MAPLSEDEVTQALARLDGWERHGSSIRRELRFSGFPEAVAFLVRLAFAAEAANHHPDVDLRYNKVHVSLMTHSQGGIITAKDIDLARALSDIANPGR